MEWYIAIIIVLSAASVGFLMLIIELIRIIEDLREKNLKLTIDLLHK